MRWVYVLICEGGFIYVGETERLYRRLNEHCNKQNGASTIKSPIQSLIALYKVEGEFKLIDKKSDPIQHDMYSKGYLKPSKTSALQLENNITEMCMQSMGPYWKKVFGGKYHDGFRPTLNPSKDCEFNRPFCDCKLPADIKEYYGNTYWRCAKKNIWDKLKIYLLHDLNFDYLENCCSFYKEFKEGEKFVCENLIFDYPINNGTCQILTDSE